MWRYNHHGKEGSRRTERKDAVLKLRERDGMEDGNNKNTNHGREGNYCDGAQGTEGIGS